MLRVLGRILVVGFACLLAATVTLFVLVTLGLERVTRAAHAGADGDAVRDLIWEAANGLVVDWLLTVPGLVAMACLALVAVGEIARIRSALYYVGGGGVALAAAALALRDGAATGGHPALLATAAWQVAATAGFAGGLVYWLIAGRRA